jgi:hypothetical protein
MRSSLKTHRGRTKGIEEQRTMSEFGRGVIRNDRKARARRDKEIIGILGSTE